MFEHLHIPDNLVPSDPRFGCGPSKIPVEHLKSLYQTGTHLMGTSHRKPAVKNLVKQMQEGLRQYYRLPADYEVVLGNGGATLFFDLAALNLVKSKALHFTCGEFSQKWFQSSALVPWICAEQAAVDFGSGCVPEIKNDFDFHAMTLNETSTGVMLDSVPAKKSQETLVAVDATSGAGQIGIDMSQVDVYFFGPQKVFASDGGLWVAFISPLAKERALKIASTTGRYIPPMMNLKIAMENAIQNQTYNTPSIATIFLLNEQIKAMNELGQSKVIEMAQQKAKHIYDWAEQKPYLSCYVKEARFRSIAVATIDVDEKIPVGPLLKKLEHDNIVAGIDAYRKLGKNQFRIALFHNILFEDVKKLTELISLAIEQEL